MAELEEKLLANYPKQPLLWRRYIDDILCIWPGPLTELNLFLEYLNQSHHTIKFTHESSNTTVHFLDLTLYKGERHANSNILDIKPFFKPTNKFQYLENTSAHPKNTFASLAKGELTRLLRACSDEETYTIVSKKLTTALKDRGYHTHTLNKALQQVPFQNRDKVLYGKKEDKHQYDTFLKVEYTPNLNTKELRKIIRPTPKEETEVPNPCLCLSKSKNLSKILVRAKLKNFPDPPMATTPLTIETSTTDYKNSMPCSHPGCKCCIAISRKGSVTSTFNKKTYPTQKFTCCSTVYLIECNKCTKHNQYVGQTSRPLRTRLLEHRKTSKTKKNLPLYRHFTQKADHDFERDSAITILQATTKARLLQAERQWIKSMDTTYPRGLNCTIYY